MSKPTKTAARSKRPLATLALTLFSFAFALCGGEVVARLARTERGLARSPETPADALDLPEIQLSELAHANVRGLYNGVPYETNRFGIRGPEVAEQKPADVFRIAVIGDSVTMGSGVLAEDAYPARLEEALNATRDDQRYEVLNLGIPGINLRWSVRRLKHVGLPLDPDLIVYGFSLNDIEGPAYRAVVGRAPPDVAPSTSPSYLWRFLGPRLRSLRELLLPPPDSYVYELDQNYFHNPSAWSSFTADLDDLAAVGRGWRVCVEVFTHTELHFLHFFHPFRRHYDRVAEAARERGLHAHQSLPVFLGRHAPSLWVAPVDSHPNARGHALLAESLRAGLEALPPTCWRRKRMRDRGLEMRERRPPSARVDDGSSRYRIQPPTPERGGSDVAKLQRGVRPLPARPQRLLGGGSRRCALDASLGSGARRFARPVLRVVPRRRAQHLRERPGRSRGERTG